MGTVQSWVPGAVVAGRFELTERLGRGGQSDVWAAREVALGSEVALKLQRRADEESRARLRRELRVATLVRHPAVVSALEILDLEDGSAGIVLERLHGEPLAEVFAREGAVPLPRLATWLAPIASALSRAHELGIVHRDLKPANVFTLRGGAPPPSRLLDLGSTKLTAAHGDAAATAAWTRPGTTLGTPLYMSPEQAFGDEVDPRSDLWSLGVILYEGLSGRRPVQGASLSQIYRVLLSGAFPPLEAVAPDLPRPLTSVVERMLQTDRDARLGDVREVEEVLVGYAVEAPPPPGVT